MNFSELLTKWVLPDAVSTYGARIDAIYYFILWVTGVIFVLTEAALVYFSIRYRQKANPKAYYHHGNTRLEIIWTTIPTLILIYMAFASQTLWSELRSPKNFPNDALTIRVTAEQWLWHFKYAGVDKQFDTEDDIVVQNTFHVPVDKPVVFDLRAQDVIHGFYLPDLRVHQDAVPGIASQLWVTANKAGTYELRCTQFCGTNHYEMKGQMMVDSEEDYNNWLSTAKAEAF